MQIGCDDCEFCELFKLGSVVLQLDHTMYCTVDFSHGTIGK